MVREEEMKYKEVAEILSISERTVHAQMCIALKKIGIVVKEYRNAGMPVR
jgi:RNA polymerase sigma-70 factor (ECF subfamily)